MLWITSGLLAAAILSSGNATSDVLLEQAPDFKNRWISFYRPSGAQKGDDFRPDEPVVVESVTFWMVASWPNEPWMWSFSVHKGYLGHPIYDFAPFIEHFYRMFNPSSVTDLGSWPNPWRYDDWRDDQIHLFEVRFDNVGLRLDSGFGNLGVYWFSSAGHLNDYPRQSCWWATAGNGEINGDMGYQKDEPPDWPGWTLMTNHNLPPSDFAMRIEGVSADEYEPTTELTDFEVIWGEIVEGDIDDLREAGDDQIMTLHGWPVWDSQPSRLFNVQARVQSLVENPVVLDITITAGVRTFLELDATVSLRNWSTGEFEAVGTYPLATEIVTWPIRGIDAAPYVRTEDGAIDLRFQVRDNAHRSQGWFARFIEGYIDRIKIDAHEAE